MVKDLPASAGDTRGKSLIPELGRSPEEGNSNQLQYSFLGNPMDRGAWQITVHGIAEWGMTEHTCIYSPFTKEGADALGIQ